MTSSVPNCIYSVPAGQYGIWNGATFKWYKCRELFHTWNDPEATIYFSTYSVNEAGRQSLQDFIHGIEDILKVEKSSVTITNMPNVFAIKPSVFWRKQHMRLQLFTIVLRSSMGYTGDKNYLDFIYNNNYIRATKLATVKFFAGDRWYKNNKRYGWYRAFSGFTCAYNDKCICGRCNIPLSKDEPPPPVPLTEQLSMMVRRFMARTVGRLLS